MRRLALRLLFPAVSRGKYAGKVLRVTAHGSGCELPPEQPGPQDRSDERAKPDRRAVPDGDERHGIVEAVERVGDRPDRSGDQARDRASGGEVRRRAVAQGPNQRSERNEREERNAIQAGGPLRAEHHAAPGRRRRKEESGGSRRRQHQKWQRDQTEQRSSLPARMHQPGEIRRPGAQQRQRKEKLEREGIRMRAEVSPWPEDRQHRAEGAERTQAQRQGDRLADPSPLDRLDVGAQYFDEAIGLHASRSLI